jgi:hypothetical protein
MLRLNRPKQSSVLPDKSPTESSSCRGVHDVEWWCCLLEVKESFEFNHKVMILKFRSRHLILWSLEYLMVYESLCKGSSFAKGRRIITYLRLTTLLINCFFKSCFYLLVSFKVQGRSPFVKKFLPYWIKS